MQRIIERNSKFIYLPMRAGIEFHPYIRGALNLPNAHDHAAALSSGLAACLRSSGCVGGALLILWRHLAMEHLDR